MLLNGRTYKVLNLDDLNSLISFEEWIKNNLSLYPDDEKVSSNHLKIFLQYIKNNARDQRVQDKKAWFDQIDQLLERADSK